MLFLHINEPIHPPVDGSGFVKCGKKPRPSDDSVLPFTPASLAVPLDDMDTSESKGRALKALKLASGSEREDGGPSIRDNLGYGNIVCAENVHNDFQKWKAKSKF